MKVKIWVDDIRPAPDGYVWCKSVNAAIDKINLYRAFDIEIELLDLDHDAGDYRDEGGDYIRILDYFEYYDMYDIPIRIHSMNPVGVENMRRIINRNGWKEIL